MNREDLLPVQYEIECRYGRHNTRQILRKALDDSKESGEISEALNQADSILSHWLYEVPAEYHSKELRKLAFSKAGLNVSEFIDEVMLVVLGYNGEVPVQTVAGILAPHFKELDVFEGVKLVSELIGFMAEADVFDIYMPLAEEFEEVTLMIQTSYVLDDITLQELAELKYLPPMIVEPCKVHKHQRNYTNQYLTRSEHLVLGSGVNKCNQHDKSLAIDVINTASSQALSLDEFVLNKPETPNKPLDTLEKQEQFRLMAQTSRKVYGELHSLGNQFYLTYRFDKRGRLYSQGYHVNIQSTEYKKALINLAERIKVTI